MDKKAKIMEAMQVIAEEVKKVIEAVLQGADLGDSQLYKDLQVNAEDIGLIKITVNDYITYIQSGRKKGSGYKHHPPFEELVKWCTAKGLPSDNDTVIRIMWRIYWHGIKNPIEPRPLFETYEGEWVSDSDSPISRAIDKEMEAWGEIIIDAITSELNEEFKGK